MPTSSWKSISDILDYVLFLNPRPKTILDIGLGNGKYGFLLKEYFTLWGNRYSDQKLAPIIDGIDVFPKYISSMQKAIYDEIFLGNAMNIIPSFTSKKYDLVLAIDILEHLNIENGRNFIEECSRIGKVLIISTPIEFENQGAAYGNTYETHLSLWNKELIFQAGAFSVVNSCDQNWIAVFSDSEYHDSINFVLHQNSKFKKLIRIIIPYHLRRKLSTLFQCQNK